MTLMQANLKDSKKNILSLSMSRFKRIIKFSQII